MGIQGFGHDCVTDFHSHVMLIKGKRDPEKFQARDASQAIL